jgi:hypothetical protein
MTCYQTTSRFAYFASQNLDVENGKTPPVKAVNKADAQVQHTGLGRHRRVTHWC